MDLVSAQTDRRPGARGEIILASRSPVVECRVLALTATGATLAVPAGTVVTDAVTLAIAGEFVMRRCRVVWRLHQRLGVAFELPA